MITIFLGRQKMCLRLAILKYNVRIKLNLAVLDCSTKPLGWGFFMGVDLMCDID